MKIIDLSNIFWCWVLLVIIGNRAQYQRMICLKLAVSKFEMSIFFM